MNTFYRQWLKGTAHHLHIQRSRACERPPSSVTESLWTGPAIHYSDAGGPPYNSLPPPPPDGYRRAPDSEGWHVYCRINPSLYDTDGQQPTYFPTRKVGQRQLRVPDSPAPISASMNSYTFSGAGCLMVGFQTELVMMGALSAGHVSPDLIELLCWRKVVDDAQCPSPIIQVWPSGQITLTGDVIGSKDSTVRFDATVVFRDPAMKV